MPSFVELKTTRDKILTDVQYTLPKAVSLKETIKDHFVYQPTPLKAVGQEPTPGTLLTVGSKVVVYFEDTDDLSLDIFEGAHSGYTGRKANEVIEKVQSNNAVRKIIESREKSEDLTPEETVIMKTFFIDTLGLEMDENISTKNSKAAYDVIVASYGLMK